MTKEISDKLTYDDLKLGEKAKEAFLRGESPEEIKSKYPVYLNTKEVYAGLNVTDLSIAGVLGKIPSLYVGRPGCGKSQLAQDFFNYYFGGNKSQGGQGVFMVGDKDLNIYDDVYRDLNIKEGRWIPNENVKGLYHFIDEINRCPTMIQNQFLRLLDGFLQHRGAKTPLGEKEYSIGVATANLGNGEIPGTFDIDWATWDRMGLVLDFDYNQFKPTDEDKMLRSKLRTPDSKTKDSPIRDISNKLIEAEREISHNSRNLGLEANAVIDYITFGLENCYNPEIGNKDKNWPHRCQDCSKNKDAEALCSLVRNPEGRILETLPKFVASLDYLIKLKNPNSNHDAIDLGFKAFELTGAYQKLLNPMILRQKYNEQNPKMMGEVVESLKVDFRKNEDFILTSLEKAQNGDKFDDYFKRKADGKIGFGHSKLSKNAKEDVQKLNPFVNDREIGLSWVKEQAEIYKTLNKLKGD